MLLLDGHGQELRCGDCVHNLNNPTTGRVTRLDQIAPDCVNASLMVTASLIDGDGWTRYRVRRQSAYGSYQLGEMATKVTCDRCPLMFECLARGELKETSS